MDEDISIINTNTRNEKIKNFFVRNKIRLLIIFSILLLILLSFFSYNEYKNKQKLKISNLYNSIIIDYSNDTKDQTKIALIEIIKKRNPTYSPLSLYFLIDNNLVSQREETNDLFDILIKKTQLEYEIKNLIIYKKALYNAEESNENELLIILNPLINSDSVWKSHALYLMAEFFYSKNEKQKSKEFFDKIITLQNSNPDILQEAKKRLNRDLSD